MKSYNGIPVPAHGEIVEYQNSRLAVPHQPIIPFIEGDGVGPDIWRAARVVFDAAVQLAYGGRRAVAWYEVLAGEKAFRQTGSWLPEETVEAIRQFRFAIKGPLTTPVGGGIRSLNVTLRQVLNLYVCMRPVKYYPGVPSPMKHPERLDVVIFRENTEDVYAGIEWKEGSPEARKVIEFLEESLGVQIRPDSGIGVKPMSEGATRRLVRRAIQYALDNRRRSVVLVHKGNIMKYTEGAFRDWGYQLAAEEFPAECVRETDGVDAAPGQVVIKDRIADSMFQQVLLRPDEYDVIATPNLNGDYLSDACAAQTGGLGMAPGANLGDGYGVFEATHGTAPRYANQDAVNPGSLILSGALLFSHLGWPEAARLIEQSLTETIRQRKVTYDLHRQMEGASLMKTSEFAQAMVSNMAVPTAA